MKAEDGRSALSLVRRRVKHHLQSLIAPTPTLTSSRETFLAMAEMLRRRERIQTAPVDLDLTPYELRVFSQNGEDGVLDEILRRTGTDTRTFVEFGTASGVEASCTYLAEVAGWNGHFLEMDDVCFERLRAKYAMNRRVTTTHAVVTPANVEEIFARLDVPTNLDVLSIDVDGQDYWIWEAVSSYHPRVVIIEYNGALDAPLVIPRDSPPWDRTGYFGASLAAMRQLATKKGYRFAHSDLTGVNAFFVRADLAGGFAPEDAVPMRAANYQLSGGRHPPGEGTYVRV